MDISGSHHQDAALFRPRLAIGITHLLEKPHGVFIADATLAVTVLIIFGQQVGKPRARLALRGERVTQQQGGVAESWGRQIHVHHADDLAPAGPVGGQVGHEQGTADTTLEGEEGEYFQVTHSPVPESTSSII